MKEIKMVDLKGQYQKIKNEIDDSLREVFDTTAFIRGPKVKEFETALASYLGVKKVIACANGTDALQVALMALELKPGDEIITSDFTFIATVEVIALLGLKPVLIDVDINTFNIEAHAIENVITDRTKAIIPVHLFGQCSNMEKIMSIAQKYNLYVIEDNAQALGTEYIFSTGNNRVKSGTIGDIGCTSFFPSKNLGCYGDGGALFTNNDELAERISSLVNHGMTMQYYHDFVGINSRLDSVQAAILLIKLKYLDNYCKERQKAAAYYNRKFSGHPKLIIPAGSSFSSHVFHQYTLRFIDVDRQKLMEYLKSKGIPTAIYYPVPLHLQNAYKYLNYTEGDFPVTEALCKTIISLPMHTELDEEQLEYITTNILNFADNY
ncbi:MAG: DegT/DnrJ/EryC1/StrS family aminotransferase [Bacteroidia bacterium]|nr:DegT/DnrJ/EryC1/StrS family aminotransferase [Bacteroidia bacterium]